MKKVIITLLSVLFIISFTILIVFFVRSNKVRITNDAEVNLIYEYENQKVNQLLDNKDSKVVLNILNGKELYTDNPTCGFDTNISLSFDNNTFCVACDGCPIIKYRKRYISLSNAEIAEIHNIMEKYGVKFPCI